MKNMKTMFFVLTLLTLLLAVTTVSAVDNTTVTDDTTAINDASSDTISTETVQTSTNEQTATTKNMEKEDKTVKKDSITINNVTYEKIYEHKYIADGAEFYGNCYFNDCKFMDIEYVDIYDGNAYFNNSLFNNVYDSIIVYNGNITINNSIIKNSKIMGNQYLTIYIEDNEVDSNSILQSASGILGNYYRTYSNYIFNENKNFNSNMTIINSTINNTLSGQGIANLTIGENVSFTDNGYLTSFYNISSDNMTRILPYIDRWEGDYILENTIITKSKVNNGNMTFHGCTLNATINNYGVMNISDDCTLNATINNYGVMNISDDTIFGENFRIMGNGTIIINDYNHIMPYTHEIYGENTLENITINTTKSNYGNLTLINCSINSLIENSLKIVFINCSFSNNRMTVNSVKVDGFLLNNRGNATLINCLMENNSFNTTAINTLTGHANIIGGAIFNNATLNVYNSSFCNNSVGYFFKDQSDVWRTEGGAACIYNNGSCVIDNCNFSDNYASRFGAAVCSATTDGCNCNITNSTFTNNVAGTEGGALCGSFSLDNCNFTHNGVEVLGHNSGSTCYGGGAITGSGNFTNCIFSNNYAMSGSLIGSDGNVMMGVDVGGGAISTNQKTFIDNSSFIGNNASRGAAILNGNLWGDIGGELTVNNSLFQSNCADSDSNSSIIYCGGSVSNITNNQFVDNYNASYVINNQQGACFIYAGVVHMNTSHSGNQYESIVGNTFTNNSVNVGTIYSLEPEWITKEANIYTNTTINDTVTLDISNKIYADQPTTITGTYAINNPDDYDANILEQTKFNIYINGNLNQTVDTLEFTITPTTGSMIITVQPSISQTRKSASIRATTLTNITITPENYNEYIYEGTLIGVGKDTKITFNGQFTDKGEIYIDTSDIILDGSNATFTNTRFILDAENIILQNMNINNNETRYTISNYKDNNIITDNKITVKNTNTKTSTIYNTASNTLIANNTLTIEAPTGDIDFSTGQGVADTQAILLLGGNNNTLQNNTINIKATSSSFYGTLEAITNSNGATNTLITQNTINISKSNFNYAIDSLNNVENITITQNTINVDGERYCDAIQIGNNAKNILIDGNNMTCTCINTTPLTSEGALSYGVIGTSMGGDLTTNMTIINNNIQLTATVSYAIELYWVNTTEIHNNNITVNGPYSLGIGYAYSPNGNATKNKITINGDSSVETNYITEEIKQENTGIRIQNGTQNINLEYNTITTNDLNGQDSTIHTDESNVTIRYNKLTSSKGYGEETIIAPEDAIIENNVIKTNITTEDVTTLTNTPTTLTATVTTETGANVNGGTVTFTDAYNNTIATATVNNGTATATATFKQADESTITATYTPTSTGLNSSTTTATVTVKDKFQTSITIDEVTATAGETITLKANILDENGEAVTGGKVTFKVNGKTIKDASGKVIYAKVVNGVATAQYTVPENLGGQDINITAVYTGTTKYNKETTTITTTVTAPEAKLTITPITSDVQTGSIVTLKAKVAVGDKAITIGKIVFKVNGKTVKDTNGKVIYAKVDANGEVSVDYTIPESFKVGTYNIEAVFTASGYDKITDNTTMTVVKS